MRQTPPPQRLQRPAGRASRAELRRREDRVRQRRLRDGDDALRCRRAVERRSEAALFAARSVRKLNGCPSAVTRFDQVMRAAAGTTAGNDATLEGGQCYRLMGQTAAAQTRLQSLLTVPGYVDRAKSELAAMAPKASAKAVTKPAAPPPASQKAVNRHTPYRHGRHRRDRGALVRARSGACVPPWGQGGDRSDARAARAHRRDRTRAATARGPVPRVRRARAAHRGVAAGRLPWRRA